MKKVLATIVLAFSLAGVYVSADGREAPRQTSVQEMSVTYGSLNSLVLQNGRRRRRRWRRNNGNWQGNGNGNWNRRRWMRRRGDDNWHRRGRRGRGRRGGEHGEDHD